MSGSTSKRKPGLRLCLKRSMGSETRFWSSDLAISPLPLYRFAFKGCLSKRHKKF